MTSLYGAKTGVNASSVPPWSRNSTNWTPLSPVLEASMTSLTMFRWNVANAGAANTPNATRKLPRRTTRRRTPGTTRAPPEGSPHVAVQHRQHLLAADRPEAHDPAVLTVLTQH